MIGIIITILLLILGYYFLYRTVKEEDDNRFITFAIISILFFILAVLCPLITKNRYVYNVTVVAQDGQEYSYEECYIEQERTKVIIRIKNKEPVIFYTPIKVDQERMEKDAD